MPAHRNLTLLPAMILAAVLGSSSALAQTPLASVAEWPSKPIRLIAPFAHGGPTDQASRTLAPKLAEALGKPVFVENIPGAGSTLGTGRIAQAEPDGHTFGLGHVGALSIAPAMYDKLGYDPLTSYTTISLVCDFVNILVVRADSPVRSVADLIAQARSRPGALTYGSAGIGSSNHLSGELLASMAGVKMTHVPYKGSAPAMVDLIGGRLDFMFDILLNSMPNVQSGRLRILGVTSLTEIPSVPGIPPVAQAVPSFEVLGWVGLLGPAGLPKPITDRLNAEIARIMQMPEIVKAFAGMGYIARTSTPEAFHALIEKDLRMWDPIIRGAGIRAN
jgi:tripartite-type tricarboxylate transporter receptor subunit TctC